MSRPIIDVFEREPKVGDEIIYVVRRGSWMWMKSANVVAVENVTPIHSWNPTTRIKVNCADNENHVYLTNPLFVILRKPWE